MRVTFSLWTFHKFWKRQKNIDFIDFIDFWLPYSFMSNLQKQVVKLASRLFYRWSLLRADCSTVAGCSTEQIVLLIFIANTLFYCWSLRKYTYLFLERCRKSNNVWLRALMQSDCLYSLLYFEHYNRILLCEWVIELNSVSLIDDVSSHIAFAFYL